VLREQARVKDKNQERLQKLINKLSNDMMKYEAEKVEMATTA
jgi:uncharacterized coiled-coil protein SlyX